MTSPGSGIESFTAASAFAIRSRSTTSACAHRRAARRSHRSSTRRPWRRSSGRARPFPSVPHVAVFDTAFHATIPPEAATYAVPARWREWGVRRYGFHGLAVAWIAEQVRVPRLVVCHLGGGCSITAVRDGRSIDTTMGFSPLEGVPMATRSGSVDPGALVYLQRERGLSVEELDRCLQEESGLAALGGLDEELGFAVYTYRVALAVAGMAAALGGLDVLAFSGGVGENRPDVRDAVAERVAFLGPFDVRAGAGEVVVGAGAARHAAARGGSRSRPYLLDTSAPCVLATDTSHQIGGAPEPSSTRPRRGSACAPTRGCARRGSACCC